ncbi:MAG TPA: hypothetical protein VMU62_06125, partial [Acidobacteriaceae bacterium]|nr:hypothetical protein [Acidobacteriaceae bacterium]
FVYVTPPDAAPFLATFALGFAEPSVPHGIWSCPNPNQLCAVAGGYAYIIDITQPEVWQQIPYRPVTTLYVAAEQRLLLFSGFHSLFALGENGRAWETSRLSWEGLRITGLEADTLSGFGWDLMTDTEVLFTVDLLTGGHTGGAAPN